LLRAEFWSPKLRTAVAISRLLWAQLLVRLFRFEQWRERLGFASDPRVSTGYSKPNASRLAADIEWAARRLPFSVKCLPRAMALSWALRRQRIGHAVVIAVRPDQYRRSTDALHAWIEVEGEKVIGDLPGPWIEMLRLGK
jgi:hypothetical protein